MLEDPNSKIEIPRSLGKLGPVLDIWEEDDPDADTVAGSGNDDNAHMGVLSGKHDTEIDTPGFIHKYEGANYVSSLPVPAGGRFDIINQDF